MNKIKVNFILWCFTMLNCFLYSLEDFEEPEYSKHISQLFNQTFKHFEKEYQLHPLGQGGSLRGCVSELSLSTVHYGALSFEDARILIVKCLNDFLENINSYEDLLPFLKPSPFKIENINMCITIQDKEGNELGKNSLMMVLAHENKLVYFVNSDKEIYEVVLKETYEEALSKLKFDNTKKDTSK